jgi:hypothetical protein
MCGLSANAVIWELLPSFTVSFPRTVLITYELKKKTGVEVVLQHSEAEFIHHN